MHGVSQMRCVHDEEIIAFDKKIFDIKVSSFLKTFMKSTCLSHESLSVAKVVGAGGDGFSF